MSSAPAGELSRHLLEHLDAEEAALGPVFLTWQGWPPR
jgi:hypothetical protein